MNIFLAKVDIAIQLKHTLHCSYLPLIFITTKNSFCTLFNNNVSNADYIVLNEWMILKNKVEWVWNEIVVT
jgi:hypothetical protein